METALGHWPRHLRVAPQDSNPAKETHQENRGSRREGRDHLGKRKALRRAEESPCQTTRSRSRRAAVHLPAEPKAEDVLDEGYGCWAQHVPSSGQRVQVRNRAPHSWTPRNEAKVLRVEAPWGDAARGSSQAWTAPNPPEHWPSTEVHGRWFPSRHLSERTTYPRLVQIKSWSAEKKSETVCPKRKTLMFCWPVRMKIRKIRIVEKKKIVIQCRPISALLSLRLLPSRSLDLWVREMVVYESFKVWLCGILLPLN